MGKKRQNPLTGSVGQAALQYVAGIFIITLMATGIIYVLTEYVFPDSGIHFENSIKKSTGRTPQEIIDTGNSLISEIDNLNYIDYSKLTPDQRESLKSS